MKAKWWQGSLFYLLILVAVLALAFSFLPINKGPEEVDFYTFVDQAKRGDIDTIEQADKLVGKELLIEASRVDGVHSEADDSLIGFTVTDHEKGAIGSVSGIMETAQHPILEVEFEGKTILIPWVKEIVKKIDVGARSIEVEAPDGLIDLYLNG